MFSLPPGRCNYFYNKYVVIAVTFSLRQFLEIFNLTTAISGGVAFFQSFSRRLVTGFSTSEGDAIIFTISMSSSLAFGFLRQFRADLR